MLTKKLRFILSDHEAHAFGVLPLFNDEGANTLRLLKTAGSNISLGDLITRGEAGRPVHVAE